MANRTLPPLSAEVKAHMKAERLQQYRSRIFSIEMDVVAYTAVGDKVRLEQAEKNLRDFTASYYAIEAME